MSNPNVMILTYRFPNVKAFRAPSALSRSPGRRFFPCASAARRNHPQPCRKPYRPVSLSNYSIYRQREKTPPFFSPLPFVTNLSPRKKVFDIPRNFHKRQKTQDSCGLRGSSSLKKRRLKPLCYEGYRNVTFRFLQCAQKQNAFFDQQTRKSRDIIL